MISYYKNVSIGNASPHFKTDPWLQLGEKRKRKGHFCANGLTQQVNSSPEPKEQVQTPALALGHTGAATAAAQEPNGAWTQEQHWEAGPKLLCMDHLCDTHSALGVGIMPFFLYHFHQLCYTTGFRCHCFYWTV